MPQNFLPLTEEPPFIGDWVCETKLGSGGFGFVTLWRNKKTKEAVGKILIKNCSFFSSKILIHPLKLSILGVENY